MLDTDGVTELSLCKMFWHVPGLSAASPVSACTCGDYILCRVHFFIIKWSPCYFFQVDTILDKENFKLEDLLDEDEIIQECKALNTRLINLYRFSSRALFLCGCFFLVCD